MIIGLFPRFSNFAISVSTESIIAFLEQKLFDEGYPTYKDLQGMYWSQYKRMSSGYLKKIYQNDRPAFDKEFADFLKDINRY